MSILSKLATPDDIQEEADVLGGSRTVETGLYAAKVTMAYVIKSDNGAMGVVLTLNTGNNREVRESIYITSGNNKGNKTYYEKDGEKRPLPGFTLINNLCLLTVGKEISEMETEEKLVNVYSAAAKKEVATKVDVLVELTGQDILAAIFKEIQSKTKMVGTERVNTGETREANAIDKFFRARDRMSAAEIRANAPAAVFADAWATKWNGITRDKSEAVSKGGTAANQTAGAKPTKSLFK